jgi:hypothetical protein
MENSDEILTNKSTWIAKLIEKEKEDLKFHISDKEKEIANLTNRLEAAIIIEKSRDITRFKNYLNNTSTNLHSNSKYIIKVIPFWDNGSINRNGQSLKLAPGFYYCVIKCNIDIASRHAGNIHLTYYAIDIKDIHSQSAEWTKNTLMRVGTFTKHPAVYKSRAVPKDMKKNFKVIKKILDDNFSRSMASNGKNPDDSSILNNWIKSFMIDYVNDILKVKSTSKKFGL